MDAKTALFYVVSILDGANVSFTLNFDLEGETLGFSVDEMCSIELTFDELAKLDTQGLLNMVKSVLDPTISTSEPYL